MKWLITAALLLFLFELGIAHHLELGSTASAAAAPETTPAPPSLSAPAPVNVNPAQHP